MKKLFLLILYCITIFNSMGQTSSFQTTKDALKIQIENTKEDTTKVNLLIELSERYPWSYPDTALLYAHLALSFSVKMDYKKGIYGAQNVIINALSTMGNYPLALEYKLKNEELSKSFIVPKANAQIEEGLTLTNISRNFLEINQPDSALLYAKKSFQLIDNWPTQPINIGHAYLQKDLYDSAVYWFKIGLVLATANQTEQDFVDVDNLMAILHKKKNNIDSSIWYSKKALSEKISMNYPLGMLRASDLLVSLYESQHKQDSAFLYLKMSISLKDSIFSREKAIAEQNLLINKREREMELKAQQLKSKNQIRLNSLIGGLATLILLSFLLFRNSQNKQKAYNLLQGQKIQIDQQKAELEHMIINLQSTQAQLIQSEKMASLGELTAGIAHEIQNPLNFVNNFASINVELIDEMNTEIQKGTSTGLSAEQCKLTKELANDIKDNEQKIMHHGKRAASIVKGMLEHSRKSSGVKEPTDLNKMCDEFVRLSYHGLRAKDKDFNCEYKLDLDPNLPLVNVVSQDIGRVILNIVNNAFQACSEKSGSLKLESQKDKKELVSISTKYVASLRRCELIISDNGPGIPDEIKHKIFQPFFTTKPTGQGTGLGLSLAYDIVKAQGGELKVETKEGVGCEFVIQIPTK